jgi:RNA 2',3'-cyclic 3'-phosphodiesterase
MTPDPDAGGRFFFAVWPDRETQERIGAAAAVVQCGAGAQFVPRENYHLTLAFVGEADSSQLSVLRQIGRDLGGPGFQLKFDVYEYWPKPEVVVAAARDIPAVLGDIWQRLHRDLAGHALAQKPKRLRPHATLARKVTQAPVWPDMSAFEWRAREFSLVRSDSAGAGSVYTVLDTWSLLDESSKE